MELCTPPLEPLGGTLLTRPPQRARGPGHRPPPPPASGPARFWPERPVRWAVGTAMALAVGAGVGLAIPGLLEPLVGALPAGEPGAEAPWLRWVLQGFYALFVLLVVCPLAVFWAWSRMKLPPAPVREGVPLPRVSILIPAFNEQEMILDAVHAALAQDYPDVEVIVVDDGSSDLTAYLAASQPVRLIRKRPNGGKAAALNTGLAAASGEVIVTCDADGYLDPQAVRHLVAALDDPQVAAVAGRVRLFESAGWLQRFQAMEYAANQGLLKRAMSATTGTVLVAPGPVSAYRADALRAAGGVPAETLTEDFDLTMALVSRGHRVAYEPRAVAYTDAPRTDAELRRQRVRWSRGGFQVLRKYVALNGDRRYGLLGLFWLPYLFFTGYLVLPLQLLLLAALPLMGAASGDPTRFMAGVFVYWLVVVAFEAGAVVLGALSDDRRDLRHLALAPFYCCYKNWRMRQFTAVALLREWRGARKLWNA